MRNKTFVIGCGRLGAAIALDAYKAGDSVTVIDQNERTFSRLDEGTFAGFTEVADATDARALEDFGILSCRDAIITTGDDNVNLFLAHLLDRRYKVPHIYVRFNDPNYRDLIAGYNVRAIYPFQLSYDTFVGLKKEGDE